MQCPNCKGNAINNLGPYKGKHSMFSSLTIVRCQQCSLAFSDPMPDQTELSNYYQHYWEGEVAVVSLSTRRYYLAQSISRVRYIKQFFGPKGNWKVLDIGAGPGLFLDALKYEGISALYTAVEPDHEQQASLGRRQDIQAVYGDLSQIPRQGGFDLIILSHVLEHVTDPHPFISELVSLLNPDGCLFVEVPNGDHRYKSNFEPHLLFFSEHSLRVTLAEHGTVTDLSTVGKKATVLQINQPHPSQRKIASITKEILKTILALLTPRALEKQIRRYQLDQCGSDRQWLRAILNLNLTPDSGGR